MEKEVIRYLHETFSLSESAMNYAALKSLLSNKINHWIITDFNKLIHVLYRIDVSETKINALLKYNNSEDASDILADLIIERELQKAEARKHASNNSTGNSEEEKW